MDEPHFYLAFQLPCLDEWKDKPPGTQNASTHAMSEMISFYCFFPFQFAATLLDFRLLTGHLIFPDFKREQGYRPHLEQMTTGDIPLIERVMVLPPFAIWQLALLSTHSMFFTLLSCAHDC